MTNMTACTRSHWNIMSKVSYLNFFFSGLCSKPEIVRGTVIIILKKVLFSKMRIKINRNYLFDLAMPAKKSQNATIRKNDPLKW